MTYKQFRNWCSERACDGCWCLSTALYCLEVISTINRVPLWKREKLWKNEYEVLVVEGVLKPINQKMIDMGVK